MNLKKILTYICIGLHLTQLHAIHKVKGEILLRDNGHITAVLEGSSTHIILPEPGNHDITHMNDTIVNPANTMLQHGGGVAAAISKAAGPELQAWSDAIPLYKINPPYRVKIGQAIISPAFNLKKRGINYIVHTVGPDMRDTQQAKNGDKLLYDAWYNALQVAACHDQSIKEIYFPSISTGIFGFNKKRAGEIAIQAITDFIRTYPNRFASITIVLWPDTFDAYANAIEKIIDGPTVNC
ncbi:MAG TPA: macro domain-containing protein [Candidatus Babeliales bacterium]|nr:macro domain-containing protein [Candidatus Babeliales bacterium]